MQQQTLTLAAMCQVAQQVQQLSRSGKVDQKAFTVMLNSIVNTSPTSTLNVYGDALENLKMGLTTLVTHLGDKSAQKDPEITRYVVSLMALERSLQKRHNKMNELGSRIEQSKRQLAHYDIDSETLMSSLASIYSDIISPLGTPIQVAGEPEILKQSINQHKIRALLLAGIRSCVLWRQVGGKRRNIIFSRRKIVDCAKQLLNNL